MPIDARIPLMAQAPQQQNPLNMLMQMMQYKQAMESNKLNTLKLQQMQQQGPLQLQALQAKAAAAQKLSAFNSPENLSQYTTQGREAIPPVSQDVGGVGPHSPAISPSVDYNRLINAGVSQGIFDPMKVQGQRFQQEETKSRNEGMEIQRNALLGLRKNAADLAAARFKDETGKTLTGSPPTETPTSAPSWGSIPPEVQAGRDKDAIETIANEAIKTNDPTEKAGLLRELTALLQRQQPSNDNSIPAGLSPKDTRALLLRRAEEKAKIKTPKLTTIVDPANKSKKIVVDLNKWNPNTREGVIGESPQSSGMLKAQTAIESKKKGKEETSVIIGKLREYYSQLKGGNGIVSTEEGSIPNITASVKQSYPGQIVQGAMGTKNQSTRNSILQLRPLLIMAIKNADGMTGKQMDSEKELQFYLQAVTDPSSIDFESNMRTLDHLEGKYGLSSLKDKEPKVQMSIPPEKRNKGELYFDAQGNPL